MEVAFHVTTCLGMTHVILETTTWTSSLKGGGFGLTPSLYHLSVSARIF